MDLTLENLVSLDRGVKKIYNDCFKEYKKDYLEVATVVTTKNHTVDYAWLNDFPAMKEWVENRDLKELESHKYSISKKDWEASVTVYRDDILFDNLSMVKPRVENLAHVAIEHYNSYVGQLIVNNSECYDKETFFSQKHKIGDETISNQTDLIFNSENLMNVYQKMLNLKKSNGHSYRIKPTMLYISASLLGEAMKVLNSDTIDGSSNITKNLVKYKVIPELKDNSWVLVDNSKPIKPFVIQITKKAQISKSEGDLFKSKKIHYGIDTMDNAGYTFWQLAYFSTGIEKSS